MKILVFNMIYPDKKWDIYLAEILGEEIAKKCRIEAHATAKIFEAKIRLLNFNGDKKIIAKLENDKFVEYMYIAEGHTSSKI